MYTKTSLIIQFKSSEHSGYILKHILQNVTSELIKIQSVKGNQNKFFFETDKHLKNLIHTFIQHKKPASYTKFKKNCQELKRKEKQDLISDGRTKTQQKTPKTHASRYMAPCSLLV